MANLRARLEKRLEFKPIAKRYGNEPFSYDETSKAVGFAEGAQEQHARLKPLLAVLVECAELVEEFAHTGRHASTAEHKAANTLVKLEELLEGKE